MSQDLVEHETPKGTTSASSQMVLDRTDLDSALMFLAVVHEALSTQEKAFLAKEVEEVAKKTAAYRSKEMKKKTSTRRENTSKHCLVPSIRVEHLADLDIKRRDMYHCLLYTSPSPRDS